MDKLGFIGVNIEPGFGQPARHPDDAVYWPVYQLARSLKVPVFIMSGPTTPEPRFNDPAGLAKVAQAFPDLPLVVYHGYWPHVQQAIGLAFRYVNVYLVPDMYVFQPGHEGYVQAANQFLADQLLFGSSYPFRPIDLSIEDFTRLGFDEAILDKLLYGNAARLLGLSGQYQCRARRCACVGDTCTSFAKLHIAPSRAWPSLGGRAQWQIQLAAHREQGVCCRIAAKVGYAANAGAGCSTRLGIEELTVKIGQALLPFEYELVAASVIIFCCGGMAAQGIALALGTGQ